MKTIVKYRSYNSSNIVRARRSRIFSIVSYYQEASTCHLICHDNNISTLDVEIINFPMFRMSKAKKIHMIKHMINK